jgi:hypothetical protein
MKYQILIKDGNGISHVLETHDYLPKAQERFTRLEVANNLRSGQSILIIDPQWESIELQSVHVLEESEVGLS